MNDIVTGIDAFFDRINRPRLFDLENAIVAAKPTFLEAAENILSPMKAYLDTLDPHHAAKIQSEYDALFDALIHEAEERGEI